MNHEPKFEEKCIKQSIQQVVKCNQKTKNNPWSKVHENFELKHQQIVENKNHIIDFEVLKFKLTKALISKDEKKTILQLGFVVWNAKQEGLWKKVNESYLFISSKFFELSTQKSLFEKLNTIKCCIKGILASPMLRINFKASFFELAS